MRCAAEGQRGMIDREPEVLDERHIRFRIGINLGDVVEAEGQAEALTAERHHRGQVVAWGLAVTVSVLALQPSPAVTDAQVRQAHRRFAAGHLCACPHSSARNGSDCGGRGACSRPG